jgi:thymidylate synthase (FAD)
MSNDAELHELLTAPPAETRRPVAPGIEPHLYRPVPLLDHGFVRVVDYMGDDGAIVQAARVSYGRGTRGRLDDRGLIRYLMRHRHTTPFEMCELKLHVKLPIFVARQWIRHRMANVNEYSARYSILDREFYVPRPEDVAVQSASNKQGRGHALDDAGALRVLDLLRGDALRAYETYEALLNDDGTGAPVAPESPQVARELARIGLGVNYYTQWYWKIDLHNLLHFLSLRAHPHAQREIRVYAEAIGSIVADWVPAAWEAFVDYRMEAASLSRAELAVVRAALAGADLGPLLEGSSLSPRERRELLTKLGR